ncbi:hypothetical protein FB451DRAFT_1178760 [Mycena latifolia]|nr:hypothetical protein FB451DRAFT_1178760 [Mycena latifolia]
MPDLTHPADFWTDPNLDFASLMDPATLENPNDYMDLLNVSSLPGDFNGVPEFSGVTSAAPSFDPFTPYLRLCLTPRRRIAEEDLSSLNPCPEKGQGMQVTAASLRAGIMTRVSAQRRHMPGRCAGLGCDGSRSAPFVAAAPALPASNARLAFLSRMTRQPSV